MCPAKGMWEPRSTLTQCLIVPLSLLVTEGAVLKPEHRKRDRCFKFASMLLYTSYDYFLRGVFELCHKRRRSEFIETEVLSD